MNINMDFGVNKTPAEAIKGGAFGGNLFWRYLF